jgi:hypothetical protein
VFCVGRIGASLICGVMRLSGLIVLFSSWSAGCASVYDCGVGSLSEKWAPAVVDPSLEQSLLQPVVESEARVLRNSLSGGFSWYSAADGEYLLCVPPTDKALRRLPGCFAERYILRKQGERFAVAEDISVVCT